MVPDEPPTAADAGESEVILGTGLFATADPGLIWMIAVSTALATVSSSIVRWAACPRSLIAPEASRNVPSPDPHENTSFIMSRVLSRIFCS